MSELEGKPPREDGRVLLVALFAVYLVLLAWIVLWKLEVPWVGGGALRQIKLVPFAPSAEHGASAPAEVFANILLFVPFGLYLGLIARSLSLWQAAGVIAGASLALEIAQYALAVGGSDVTDLLVNTAGGLAGIGLLALVRRRLHVRTTPVMARICAIGTVLALVLTGAFVASPFRYAQQEPLVVSTHSAVVPGIGTQAGTDLAG